MHDTKTLTNAIKVLRETGTARLTRNKEFNRWLFDDFASKCDTETRKQLKSSLAIGGSKQKGSDGLEKALTRSAWLEQSKTPEKSPKWVLRALGDLESQSQPEQHSKLLKINSLQFWTTRFDLTIANNHSAPLNRLLTSYSSFDQLEELGKQGRRFTGLLIWYQVYRELKTAGAEKRLCLTKTSDVVVALEKVASDHKVSVKDIVKCRNEAAGWMRFINVFGPGAILLAGVNAIYTKNISDDDYIFMHTYCTLSRDHVLQAATDLNTIAENIIREGLSFHGMSSPEFFEDTDNLVAQSLKKGTKASSTAHKSASAVRLDAPRLQEPLEAARNLSSMEGRQPQPDETMTSALYDAIPNFVPTTQYTGDRTGDGHISQSQWQQYSNPSWPRQQGGSGAASAHSMYDGPLGSIEQNGLSTANGTEPFPAQEWLDELCGDEGFLGVISH